MSVRQQEPEREPAQRSSTSVVKDASKRVALVWGDKSSSHSAVNIRKRTCQLKDMGNKSGEPPHKKKRGMPDKKDLCSIGHGLTVTKSTIPEAGNGLFADRPFSRGEFITWFDGTVINIGSKEREKLMSRFEDWSHLISIDRHSAIQCTKQPKEGMGGGGFINDGFNIFTRANVKMAPVSERQCLFVKASRYIKQGEELFLSYGKDYWKRFQDQFPEIYSKIFAPQIRNRKMTKQLLDDAGNLKRGSQLVNELKSTTLPTIPEWKQPPAAWNEKVARYALHKAHAADKKVLNLGVLREIDPSSDEYFDAVTEYITSLKQAPGQTIGDWKRAKRSLLPLPDNGIFKPAGRWQAAHLHVLNRYSKPDYPLNPEQLKHCLKVLEPSSAFYEHFLEDYIRSSTQLEPGSELNLCDPETKQKWQQRLDKNFQDIAPPVNYRGQPFASLFPTTNRRGGFWTRQMVYQIIGLSGISVKKDMSYSRAFVELAYEKNQERESQYFQVLKDWSHHVHFDYRAMTDGLSEKIRIGRLNTSKNRSKAADFAFKDIEGLNLNKPKCRTAAIFLQYVEHFGFDSPEILKHLNSKLINMALGLFQQPVHPTKAALYEQLYSLSWRNLSDAHSARKALNRKPHLILPGSVAAMSFDQAFETLREKGRKLETEIKNQPGSYPLPSTSTEGSSDSSSLAGR